MDAALKNPEFLVDASKLRLEIGPESSEGVTAVVQAAETAFQARTGKCNPEVSEKCGRGKKKK